MNFSSSKNGYNKKEVDLYILDLEGHITELENKNSTLEQKLERYLGKDKEIDENILKFSKDYVENIFEKGLYSCSEKDFDIAEQLSIKFKQF